MSGWGQKSVHVVWREESEWIRVDVGGVLVDREGDEVKGVR